MISSQVRKPTFSRFSGINNVFRYSGLRTGSGGVTEINYRRTDIVNYRNTDTVKQKTVLRQFSKHAKLPIGSVTKKFQKMFVSLKIIILKKNEKEIESVFVLN